MKKKSALLMFIISVFFAFHSCLDYSLPSQIELEVEGSIDLPVKISTSNWGSLLIDPLKNAFSGGLPDGIGVEIYSVDYGQDVQAFCVNIPIEISTSLNPNDYMENIDNFINMDIKWQIDKAVKVPSFRDSLPPFDVESPPQTNIPLGEDTFKISSPIEIPFSFPSVPLNSIDNTFLYAKIGKGSFTVDMPLSDGDIVPVDGEFTKEYKITIIQTRDTGSLGSPYDGLDHNPSGLPSTSAVQSLDGQNINRNDVEIRGSVTLKPIPGGGTVTIRNPGGSNQLKGKLNITMNIEIFDMLNIDWDNTSISHEPITPNPVSLAEAARYLNWIEFAKCDDDTNREPENGIGINMSFTEIIGGLEMNIKCPQLSLDATKPLKLKEEGDSIFGNNKALRGDPPVSGEDKRLQLAGSGAVTDLHFGIELSPEGLDDTVLHIPNLDLTKLDAEGKKWIRGEAKLFYNWEKAQVKMTEVLKHNGGSGGTFTGTFPDQDKNEDPIDLSLLDEYIKGFSIKEGDIKASAYLTGPDQTINNADVLNPKVLITAEYSNATESVTVIEKDQTNKIILEEKHIDIANDDYYINTYEDKNGNKIKTYKRNALPPGGNDFKEEFVKIINDRPSDLVFYYEVKLPDTIDVTRDMFLDQETKEPVPHNILANIILLMHLRLTAGPGGGYIMYPGMFDEDQDLFGRGPDENDSSKPEQDSMFTSLNVDYINFAVDFTGSFFTGGYLFIEKKDDHHTPVLFPDGIFLGGKGISSKITQKDFDTIRNNYIIPDFWLVFKEGEAITIPKNIGITSVKIEAKGKTSIKLDF
jgi:hypothetical protein